MSVSLITAENGPDTRDDTQRLADVEAELARLRETVDLIGALLTRLVGDRL